MNALAHIVAGLIFAGLFPIGHRGPSAIQPPMPGELFDPAMGGNSATGARERETAAGTWSTCQDGLTLRHVEGRKVAKPSAAMLFEQRRPNTVCSLPIGEIE